MLMGVHTEIISHPRVSLQKEQKTMEELFGKLRPLSRAEYLEIYNETGTNHPRNTLTLHFSKKTASISVNFVFSQRGLDD